MVALAVQVVQELAGVDLVPDRRKAGNGASSSEVKERKTVRSKPRPGGTSVRREGRGTTGECPGSLFPFLLASLHRIQMPRWPSKRMIPRWSLRE